MYFPSLESHTSAYFRRKADREEFKIFVDIENGIAV